MKKIPLFPNDCEPIFTGRGSVGLWAVLKALEKPGFDVLLPAGICEIVPATIIYAGLRPVFCDVDSKTGNLTLTHLKQSVTSRTIACVAVHNYGIPLEIDTIRKWCDRMNIFLIEDACNASGALINNLPVGSFGDASFYSFGYAKIISAGEGGGLIIRDRVLKQHAVRFIDLLPEKKDTQKSIENEFNSIIYQTRSGVASNKEKKIREVYNQYLPYLLSRASMRTIQMIKERLRYTEDILNSRKVKADKYSKLLNFPFISPPQNTAGMVFWRYSIRVSTKIRDSIVKSLRSEGFHASTWYPPVDHIFVENISKSVMTGAKQFGKEIINLWLDEATTDGYIKKSSSIIIKECFKQLE